MLAREVYTHLWVLPRWFALPVSTAAVVLGGVISGASVIQLVIVSIIAAALLAWSHTMNSWNDFFITDFDKGTVGERSHTKPYTAGQNLLAEGYSQGKILANAFAFLAIALGLTGYSLISMGVAPLILVPVLLTIPVTFAYSYGKKYWLPETVLLISVGPIAGLMGASIADIPNIIPAMLATIPIGILFGFAGETFDQWWDADANWDKGLRNIGAWVWHKNAKIETPILVFMFLTEILHLALIVFGVLSLRGWWALIPVVVAAFFLGGEVQRKTVQVMALLGLMSLYAVLTVVGEVI